MKVKDQVLEILEAHRGETLSGEEIASILNVTRSSVWKAINSLKQNGYKIESTTNKGYCLVIDNDILSESGIRNYVEDKNAIVIYKESTTSTNDDLLELAQNGEKRLIIEVASKQTSGRGRLGRVFESPNGGIYTSFLLNFNGIELKDVTIITPMAAVAVLRAVKKAFNIDLKIKWVNDLFLNNKKVCGILTQACVDIENSSMSTVIVGIGVDYRIDIETLPIELQNIVGTIINKDDKTNITQNQFEGILINEFLDLYNHFDSKDFLKEYKDNSLVLNKVVNFEYNREHLSGKVVDIDDECRLIVDTGSNILILSSGEVSIRL